MTIFLDSSSAHLRKVCRKRGKTPAFGRWERYSGRGNAATGISRGGAASAHLRKVCRKRGKMPAFGRCVRTGSDIMVDHVLLGNGRMLALIYPIDGKEHYRREADGKYEYSYAGYSTLWDAKKDKLMSYKYIRRKCDVLTFRIVQAVMGWL